MNTPAVILDGVTCRALYKWLISAACFAPRSIHLWWREIWLEAGVRRRVLLAPLPLPSPPPTHVRRPNRLAIRN